MVPRHYMLVRIQELLRDLQMSPKAFHDEARKNHVKLTERHIRKITSGQWDNITQPALRFLFELSQRRLGKQFLETIPHPLWGPFLDQPPAGFVDRGRRTPDQQLSQVKADLDVLTLFTQADAELSFDRPPEKHEDVREWMRTRNCLFAGGPRLNGYTEIALAELLTVPPYVSRNGSGLPFWFEWRPLVAATRESSFGTSANGPERGLTRQNSQGIPLKLRMADKSEDARLGRDAGLCVVVRAPFGSTANVTTIILAGASAPSTKAMAEALLADDLPSGLLELKDGEPQIFVHDLRWTRKEQGREGLSKRSGRWIEGDDDLYDAAQFLPQLFGDHHGG